MKYCIKNYSAALCGVSLTICSLLVGALSSCSCSSSNDDSDVVRHSSLPKDVTDKLIEHGRKDAMAAVAYPEGSFERQNAIMHIRSTEAQLRDKGLKESANLYVHGANEVLNQLREVHE